MEPSTTKVKVNKTSLLGCLAIPMAIGAISGYFSSHGITGWYSTLEKPSFNPPDWIFGPVWTLLYLLMGISLYLLWTVPKGNERNRGLFFFGFQLIFNFLWSILFFTFNSLLLALADLFLMWGCVLGLILVVRRIQPTVAYLQIPYLLWITFAGILNISIAYLNLG